MIDFRRTRHIGHILIVPLWLLSVGAQAGALPASTWGLCESVTASSAGTAHPASEDLLATELTADHGEVRNSNIFSLQGNVSIRRGSQLIEADEGYYESDAEQAQVQGNVRLQRDGLVIEGSKADFDLAGEHGYIENPAFFLTDRHARGSAESIRFESREVLRLSHATYTTCDPGDDDWYLKSRNVRLDREHGFGTATHATLSFQGVPFLYFPYITFPIDDRRKSGVLVPSFGTSNESGTEISIPYYWNIAPDYDATITPRLISRRGTQARSEFRYLTGGSYGELNLEYLPDDTLFGDDRQLAALRHTTTFSPAWRGDIDASYVSDGEYFQDLENSLSLASITHLERRADLSYTGDDAMFLGRLQGFQTVDETIPATSRPYQRLPQLLFATSPLPQGGGTEMAFHSELAHFERADSVTGSRVDIAPRISLPVETIAAYLLPELTLRYTQYQLDAQVPGVVDEPHRGIPIISVDSGVFFERDTRWQSADYLQTLEPRLYYLYVPERDQSALPLFDTGARDFGYSELFRDNRYTGADRVGDANQLSMGLTTRYIENASGNERLRASIGQIVYFDDREVTLSAGTPETRSTSDLVAEIVANPTSSWTTRADWQWNHEADRTEKGTFSLQYHPTTGRVINMSYRFRETALEQTDLSLLWPLHRRWRAVGRWNYSMLDQRTLESLAGLEYESCCWRLSMVGRSYINDPTGASNRSLFVELELKGLTSVGNRVEGLLENGILGYSR